MKLQRRFQAFYSKQNSFVIPLRHASSPPKKTRKTRYEKPGTFKQEIAACQKWIAKRLKRGNVFAKFQR